MNGSDRGAESDLLILFILSGCFWLGIQGGSIKLLYGQDILFY